MENQHKKEIIFCDRALAQRLERTEALCSAAFVEARKQLSPGSVAEWIEVAGAYAMFDGVQSPLTQTFGLGLFEAGTEEALEKLETFFKEREAPVFHEISPLADAAMLPLLNERGYRPVELTSVMYRSIEQSKQFNLSLNSSILTRIIDAGEENMWAQTSANGWSTEAPGLADFMFGFGSISARSSLPFVAELNGNPIATGVAFIHDDVALLAGASTIPEGRQKGAQMALLDARLRYAAGQGCTIAVMGASPGSQSQRNAEKNGFRVAYTRIKWELAS